MVAGFSLSVVYWFFRDSSRRRYRGHWKTDVTRLKESWKLLVQISKGQNQVPMKVQCIYAMSGILTVVLSL